MKKSVRLFQQFFSEPQVAARTGGENDACSSAEPGANLIKLLSPSLALLRLQY